jgi:hypothetical protein
MYDGLSYVRKAAAILVPKRHILLLSHMRAYTTLFGHIMGSNPGICGYYEMHIGYYSWKSLIRQKLIYFKHEATKPAFSYMFDKVLHNEHYVALSLLNTPRIKTIFCLRRPQEVIPSILKLYRSIDPSHDFNSVSFATEYYVQRLATLERIAVSMTQPFFYMDAESIKYDSNNCLGSLSDWLQLDTGLLPSYEIQRNTSKERFGDTSSRIATGKITDDRSHYSDFEFDVDLLKKATLMHDRVRNTLLLKSNLNSVFELSTR